MLLPRQIQRVIFRYHPVVFHSLLEHQCLSNTSVAHAQISFLYFEIVVLKLDDTGCGWHGSWMVWGSHTCILHVMLYIAHK